MEIKPTSIKDSAFKFARNLVLAGALTVPAGSAIAQVIEISPDSQNVQCPGRCLTDKEIAEREQRIKDQCATLKWDKNGKRANILIYKTCVIEKSSEPDN